MTARYSEKSKLSFGEKLTTFGLSICGIMLAANLTISYDIQSGLKQADNRSDSIEAKSKRRDAGIYAYITYICGDVDVKAVSEEVKLLRKEVDKLEAYIPERRKKLYNYIAK